MSRQTEKDLDAIRQGAAAAATVPELGDLASLLSAVERAANALGVGTEVDHFALSQVIGPAARIGRRLARTGTPTLAGAVDGG